MGIILSFLGRLPLWVYLCAAIAVWGGWGHLQVNHLQRVIADYKLASATAVAAQEEALRKLEQEKAQAVHDVQTAYSKRLQTARRDIDSLHTANLQLQQLINIPTSNTPADITTICGVDGERGRTIQRLLGESAQLVEEGAARVTELSAKTASLQDYIRKVCLGPKNADH